MSEKLQRRSFLNGLWVLAGATAVTEISLTGLRFLAPRATEGEFGGIFDVGDASQYPAGSVTPVEAGRFYLVRLEDGGFLAIYRRCTHLGCAVPFEPAQGQFVCPCHGSAFTTDGDVLNAPAPRPLDLFEISLSGSGSLIVDTGQPIERDTISQVQPLYV
ncbi:MAG: Rieske 2Fe-2S domain-containing protein [Anaerolineales bacterium]|jgi:cytochrome b6-f complex iron-sulfur subunit